MEKNIFGGEKPCSCKKKHSRTQFIVLTGGPGAGKTAAMEFIRKLMCQHVALLPESAGILFHGGFWRLQSVPGQKASQRAIYFVQNEMQYLVHDEKKWALGICDRGTLDGLAYWPGSEKSYLTELKTTKEREFNKYRAVIQLESPTLELGYNHDNPLRIESAEQARLIDKKIQSTWKSHPNYFYIESKMNFMEKVNIATRIITSLVPKCCDNLS